MKLLSPHEREVFLLSMRGESYAKIGKDLHMSKSYVGTIMNRVYGKIGANNAFQATMIALRANLFTQEELNGVRPNPKGLLILAMFGEGKSDGQIAQTLGHPIGTVRNYMIKVVKLLEAKSRRDALAKAQEQGYIAA